MEEVALADPMKISILLVISLVAAVSLSAAPVRVTASSNLRVALVAPVDTPSRGAAAGWSAEFETRFETALARIYGQPTQLEFVRVDAEDAAAGLRTAAWDAAVVLGERLPSPIRRGRYHAIRAVGPGEDGDAGAFLILRREQPELDTLLANAFNVAFHSEAVRRALSDRTFVVHAAR